MTLHATLWWVVYLFIYAALKEKLRPYITFEMQHRIIIDLFSFLGYLIVMDVCNVCIILHLHLELCYTS